MISLVRKARSVSVDVEEDEDDEEIMAVLDMVDLEDSSNVDAVADVMKTLDGGKQMEFLMTKFMVKRERREDGGDYPLEPTENQEDEDDEEVTAEEEPMLSRQRRFISDMFSYFTGDSQPEPEPENIHYSHPGPDYVSEPSYPVKANQHRHYRSPHPEPEPQGPYTPMLYESARNMGYDSYLSQDQGSSDSKDQKHHHHHRKRSSLDELPKKKPFIHLDP